MTNKHYLQEELSGLLPLLSSIGREIQERTACLETLEGELMELLPDDDRYHALVAEVATHRKELRLAKKELEELGCQVVGTAPLTFRIPGRIGEANRSFVWQTGDPALK